MQPRSSPLPVLHPRRHLAAARAPLAAGVASALVLALAALHPAHAAPDAAVLDAATSVPSAAQTDPIANAFADLGSPPPVTAAPHAVDLAALPQPAADTPRIAARLGTGIASYYAQRFHGRPTASGERFDMHALTAAHRTLPFGTRVQVTNPANGRSVTVRINDRGPFTRGRTIDVSQAAAQQLGLIARGHGAVELEVLAP